jgi:hypothetical protein
MADKMHDLKGNIKHLKQQHQNQILKSQHKVEADTELLEILREYAQVLLQLNLETVRH